MRILVDTNILVRLSEPSHADHVVAQQGTAELRRRRHILCIVPQNIYEFWSVATRPAESNGLGMTVDEARQSVLDILRAFRLLRDERAVFERWQRVVVEYDVKGKNAHDARLIAAIERHGLTHLLTFNGEDFRRYEGITTFAPSQIDDVLAQD